MRGKAKKLYAAIALALAAMLVASTAAMAAVTFNPDGTGFVGKGDVQLIYSWNNKQLQDNASLVQFRASTTSTTEWTCTKEHPSGDPTKDNVQVRSTETTTQGLVDEIARDNSKGKNGAITGFNLLGYAGSPTVVTDGPAVGSCPDANSGFVYDNNPTTTPGATVLEVSINGSDWLALS